MILELDNGILSDTILEKAAEARRAGGAEPIIATQAWVVLQRDRVVIATKSRSVALL